MYASGAEVPTEFYHGTNPEALLGIWLEGKLLTASELGLPVHQPSCVYAYSGRDVSTKSMYVDAGCQLCFQATVFALSYNDSKRVKVVPEGAACRIQRSAYARHGSVGAEWIFHPGSCQLNTARIRTDKFDRLEETVKTKAKEMSQELQSSASSLTVVETSSSSRGPARSGTATSPPANDSESAFPRRTIQGAPPSYTSLSQASPNKKQRRMVDAAVAASVGRGAKAPALDSSSADSDTGDDSDTESEAMNKFERDLEDKLRQKQKLDHELAEKRKEKAQLEKELLMRKRLLQTT